MTYKLILERQDGAVAFHDIDDSPDLILRQMRHIIRSGDDRHLILFGKPRLGIFHYLLDGYLRDDLGGIVIVILILQQRFSQQEMVFYVTYERLVTELVTLLVRRLHRREKCCLYSFQLTVREAVPLDSFVFGQNCFQRLCLLIRLRGRRAGICGIIPYQATILN